MMFALLCCPRGADSEGGRLNPNQISLFECPRFMSCAAGRGAEGSVKGAAFRVHRSAAETLDGFRPALP